MVACVSPSACSVDESLCTLWYATRAKRIQNNPTKRGVGGAGDDSERERDRSVIEELRGELQRVRRENGFLRAQCGLQPDEPLQLGPEGEYALPHTLGGPSPAPPQYKRVLEY